MKHSNPLFLDHERSVRRRPILLQKRYDWDLRISSKIHWKTARVTRKGNQKTRSRWYIGADENNRLQIPGKFLDPVLHQRFEQNFDFCSNCGFVRTAVFCSKPGASPGPAQNRNFIFNTILGITTCRRNGVWCFSDGTEWRNSLPDKRYPTQDRNF